MFRIAHISDLHIPPLPGMRPTELISKRLLGLYSWHRKWKNEHRTEILDALRARLAEIAPDHICVTGDLTFTTSREEIEQAAAWLESLAEPERISLVPGNHDAYVPGALANVCNRWARWMLDDEKGRQQFPFLHRRGPVDIIGLSSAIPTLTTRTVGRIGRAQLDRTRMLLERISTAGRPRILLIHHPPQDGATRASKQLLDCRALQFLLADCPVDLVLHGHLHRAVRAVIDGPGTRIPVLGASSVSAIGNRYARAHFHVLEIDIDSGPAIKVRHAEFSRRQGDFVLGECEAL